MTVHCQNVIFFPLSRSPLKPNAPFIAKPQISVATLRLFEELLKKPDKLILTNLVLRNLETRSYRMPGSGGVDERSGADLEFLEESE